MFRFCTVADVKAYLNTRAGFTGYDEKIDKLILLATKEIQDFCNRSFIYNQYEEILDLPECSRNYKVWLKEINIENSSAIDVRIDYGTAPDWSRVVPLSSSVYRVDPTKGVLTLMFATAATRDALRVSYTAGYTVGENDVVGVPSAIKEACALQSSANLERLLAKTFGQQDKAADKRTTTIKYEDGYVKGLLPQARYMLRDYVKIRKGSPW